MLKQVAVAVFASILLQSCGYSQKTGIQPYSENPFYWQYKGKPVLLIGGSKDDNLFQISDLTVHLDEMKAAGANYIRNTMSDRDDGNVRAFARIDGKYDLEKWNDEYWKRFQSLLTETAKRDIIVQIEVWDSWDFYRGKNTWAAHPFNPKNNVNYDSDEIGLPEEITDLAFEKVQPFFYSVPKLNNNRDLLKYQEAMVDKMLSYSLQYDHVLYSMNNETCADKLWGQYWAGYIRTRADEMGKSVYLTDMFDSWDPTDGNVKGAMVQDSVHHPGHSYYKTASPSNTYNHPEIYDFVDISNHNVQVGETHYQTARYVIERIEESGIIRPVTCVKIYGGPHETYWDGDPVDGQERFWRNVFAGISAVRFHRPRTGLGLGDITKKHILSLRMLSEEIPIYKFVPANGLLGDREENEAYCLADPDHNEYCVYFPAGGEISLKLPDLQAKYIVRWLNIMESKWQEAKTINGEILINLKTPGGSHWVVLLSPQ